MAASSTSASPGPRIDSTTIYSLLTTVLFLVTAWALARRLLPRASPTRIRALFIWHAFDALIHGTLEASFLYNCFFTSAARADLDMAMDVDMAGRKHGGGHAQGYADLTPPGVHFLGDAGRAYGSAYAAEGNLLARLWMVYAQADRRWGGADLTVVSLELLTVLLGTPLALYVCWLCCGRRVGGGAPRQHDPRVWIWAGWLAVGELYGGFMTFAPEWLSANSNLDGSNWMYLWLYLVFFNGLWVVIPFWVLWEAYGELTTALRAQDAGKKALSERKRQ